MIFQPGIYRCLGPCLTAALLANAAAAADVSSYRVTRGDVRVVCPMTVGGSFEAKTSTLDGSLTEESSRPAAFAGSVSVDLKDLDTGIGLRNDHLRTQYLEVEKGDGFDKAVLSDIRLGDIDWATFQGKTGFTGTFLLHGTRKTIAGQAEIRKDGAVVKVEAGFPVTLADFGIAKPQYLGIGVKEKVEATVSLVLSPAPQAGGSR